MLRWSLFAVLCASYSLTMADEIRLENVRPSRMLAMLMGKTKNDMVYSATATDKDGLIPVGLKVKADDRRSVLVAEGPKESIGDLARYVSLFDVMPRTMTAQISIDAPIDKFTSKTTTTIRNNEKHALSNEFIGLNLSVALRLNDDNTVTMFITTSQKSGSKTYVVRTKLRKVTQIVTDDLLASDKEAPMTETGVGTLIGKKGDMSTVVSISILGVVEDEGPKEIPPQALRVMKTN